MRSPTPVNSNAGKKPRKPSTVWGGLLQPHAHSVALLDKDILLYAEKEGITKQAAKQWLHQLRATKSDKVSKCFRTVVSRQINPLFVVIQVAALQHKGRQWSYAQLALDLLELHDKEAVKEELKPFAAKNDNYGDSDQQAAQILDVLYAECTEVFAVWLEELHDKLPASSLLVCAGRSASATNSTEYFADGLKTEEQRDVQARRLMVALGRNLHDCNKLLPPHEWLSVVAKGSFAGSPFVRGDAVKVGTDRLVQDMLATLSSSSFMQEMLADSCLNFPEQAAYFNNLPQQLRTDAAIPPECWRLAAIAMKRDVWILEARLWRLSCYSCHDGSVCVYGNSAGTHSQLSKHWTEPGYHLRLGQLPLPEVLGENGYTYVFLLMESSGQIVSSSMMSATQLASAQSRTFAVKSLGYDLAAMDVNSKGPDGRPMSAQATKKSKGGAVACQDMLNLTLGGGASQVNFDYDHLKPGPEGRAASLHTMQQHLQQCPAPKLTKTIRVLRSSTWSGQMVSCSIEPLGCVSGH
ncbi:TPA: hypothetical protein ACH3X2_010471 [Trebouxia sp. C0005]